MDILGPWPTTSSENQYGLVCPAWYENLTRVIPATKVTSTFATSVLVDHCVTLCGAPTPLLIDNGPQLVSKVLTAVCEYLRVRIWTANAHHP